LFFFAEAAHNYALSAIGKIASEMQGTAETPDEVSRVEAGHAPEEPAVSKPPQPAIPTAAMATKANDLEALRNAVVDAASVGAGLWLSYLFVLFYLLIAVGGVTQRDLVVQSPVKLPFLLRSGEKLHENVGRQLAAQPRPHFSIGDLGPEFGIKHADLVGEQNEMQQTGVSVVTRLCDWSSHSFLELTQR
jgi:hypothetical protein